VKLAVRKTSSLKTADAYSAVFYFASFSRRGGRPVRLCVDPTLRDDYGARRQPEEFFIRCRGAENAEKAKTIPFCSLRKPRAFGWLCLLPKRRPFHASPRSLRLGGE
jgi:hypothetical protein